MADEMKRVDVFMGPYRGNLLDMPAAEADAAIAAHWARDPATPIEEYGKAHPPLTDDERNTALEAAQTWAQAQWDAATGTATPKEGRNIAAEGKHDPQGEAAARETKTRR